MNTANDYKNKNLPQDILASKVQKKYCDALRVGDGALAIKVIDQALADGLSPSKIYLSVLAPTQLEMGKLWLNKKITVCHEHLATQTTLQEMTRLRRLVKPKAKLGKRAVIAAVDGDDHYVGPRLIADFLLLDGWDVDFLGASTPVEELIKFITSRTVDLVGLAATGPDSIKSLEVAIRKIKALKSPPKIIIGGAAVYANMKNSLALGSDGIAEDARVAVKLARKVCNLTETEQSLEQYLKSLGVRLVTYRKEQGMSQQQLAELANLDRAYISALENGKQNVTVGAIAKLADALDIGLEDILVEVRS